MSAQGNVNAAWIGRVLSVVFLAGTVLTAAPCAASITQFTGGDPGEGLAFSGNYLYAVNVNGPGGLAVQGLGFTAENATAGIQFNATNATSGTVTYGSPGPTANDAGLGSMMSTIRWASNPNRVVLDYDVLPGRNYQLQLLVDSSAYNARTQDITVDGVTVADNLAVPGPPSTNPTSWLITHTYTATTNKTHVELGPSGMVGGNPVGGDNNAVLNAFVVKELPDSTVGYWRFGDGAAGSTVTTAASLYNNGSLRGTATGAPKFSADVPGAVIREGIGGPDRPANTTSIYFDYTDGTDYVTVPFSPLEQPAEFTIEFFMKAGPQGGFPGIVQKRKITGAGSTAVGAGNITWGVGKNNTELEFARIDPANAGANQTFTIPGSTADGLWHHFAMTYSGGTWTLFQDYTKVATRTGLLIDYDGLSGLSFGWAPTDFQAYRGWLDEVRFSDRVLAPSEFLLVVPEPSSLGLALGALAAAAGYGLRRRRK